MIRSKVDPLTLAPAERAVHEVSARNADVTEYKLTAEGSCEEHLRYGTDKMWGPHIRTVAPKSSVSLRGEVHLPTSSDLGGSAQIEQISLAVRAEASNPRILPQTAAIFHDVELQILKDCG
jgi:hypothetical protein